MNCIVLVILSTLCSSLSCCIPSSPAPCSVLLPGACGFKKCDSCCQPECPATCHTLFLPRSTHANEAYFLIHGRPNLTEIVASSFDIGYLYETSFFGDDLANCLFNDTTLSFKGSQVAQRTSSDILADQFGLSPLFEGTTTFSPTIANHSFHLQGLWYAPQDSCIQGLFLRGRMTISHQARSLFNGCNPFTTITNGPDFPPGAMAPTTVTALGGLQQALAGTFTFGEMQAPWIAGRMPVGSLSDTNISGITVDIGYSQLLYDGVQDFSLFARYRPPVGTHLNGKQKYARDLFAPIIGDGHHQQLGIGASYSGEIWSDLAGRSVVIHSEAYVVHPFTNHQTRSFDLINRGCLSRYLLVKAFNAQTLEPLSTLMPAVNVTTLPVRVKLPVIGEFVIELMVRSTHATFTVGYSFYGQKAEQVCPTTSQLGCDPTVSYGLKGCTGTEYFAYGVAGGLITTPLTPFTISLNATADTTLTTTCGVIDTNGGASTLTNSAVGVAWNNVFKGNGTTANAIATNTPTNSLAIAFTSSPNPVILSLADINLCSGSAPHQLIHKGVLGLAYSWEQKRYTPYVSAGFTAEGSGRVCSLKQWGLWIKAGTNF
jgi:hypothetical protein